MPANAAAIAPEWRRTALVTIDMQRDFACTDGRAYVSGTAEIADNCARAVDAFRAAGRPIVHVIRYYEPDGSNAELGRRDLVRERGPIVAPATEGAELAPALQGGAPQPLDADLLLKGELQKLGDNEWVMFKPRWSAFFKTELESALRGWDVSTLVVSGCNLPNCPRATLFDASERDFRTVLVTDATSQVTEQRLADLSLIDVNLVTTAALVGAIERA